MGMFKVRFSYGKVGNDKIRHNNADVRFLILYAIGEGSGYDWANYGSSYGFTGLTYRTSFRPGYLGGGNERKIWE